MPARRGDWARRIPIVRCAACPAPISAAAFTAVGRWTHLGSLKTGLGLRSAAADVHTPEGTVRFVALHPRSTWVDRSRLDAAEASIETNFRGPRKRRSWLRCAAIWTSRAIAL